jgi:hypothetical protein
MVSKNLIEGIHEAKADSKYKAKNVLSFHV